MPSAPLLSTTRFPLAITDGLKLRLLQKHDPFKQWWSLTELRFCSRCEHLFMGRQIRFFQDERENVFFSCPTRNCGGEFADWQYPELHL